MKKLFFTAAMALFMGGAAMAESAKENEAKAIEINNIDYSLDVNSNSISRYLGLSEEQRDQMEYVFDRLDNDLRRAMRSKTEEKRSSRIYNAIIYNLSAAHSCLDGKQYHMYLAMLNATMKSKGLDTIFFAETLAMEE